MNETLKNMTAKFIENEKLELIHESRADNNNVNYGGDEVSNNENVVETVNKTLITQRENNIKSSEISITTSKTDYSGISPKRFKTTCYLQRNKSPYWFTESVLLHINSTRKRYDNKIFFKNRLTPVKWTEEMSTEISNPKNHFKSVIEIPVHDIYIPLKQELSV